MTKPTYRQAIQELRKLRTSHLFTVQPDGDKRTLAARGVGVTWPIWELCKVVIANAISERAEYEMPDAMKESVLENARAFHRAANAAPGLAQENYELRQALRNARQEMRQRGITTRSFAEICRISAAQLSEWTGVDVPTTPPDFID